MWVTPPKTWLQAVTKLLVTFHVACHGGNYMTHTSYITRQQKHDYMESHATSAPRWIGTFSARAGQKTAQTPRLVKVCPTCWGDRRFCPFIRPHNRIYSYDSCRKRLVGNDWTQSPRASSSSGASSVIFWDFMTWGSHKLQSQKTRSGVVQHTKSYQTLYEHHCMQHL